MTNSRHTLHYLIIFLLSPVASVVASGQGRVIQYGDSTATMDRQVESQTRRNIVFGDIGLGVSNDFPGARLNDFSRLNDSTYVARILPENHPINNSAWYAFKIWSSERRRISIQVDYEYGKHRYFPKTSHDGEHWTRLDSSDCVADTSTGEALFRLTVGPDTTWVAGQELITSKDIHEWAERIAEQPFAAMSTIGESTLGRPIEMLEITNAGEPLDFVIVISRQHPPEVTGTISMREFVETICDTTKLAGTFRERFALLLIPCMNPDGVDLGYWRHNAGGIDLNRDWHYFHQPETRLATNAISTRISESHGRVWFFLDFHATYNDVFYTMSEELETSPPGFIERWFAQIHDKLPDYDIRQKPSAAETPVSKNWFYNKYQSPSLTYEVGDDTDRGLIRQVAAVAATSMMSLLLEEKNWPLIEK